MCELAGQASVEGKFECELEQHSTGKQHTNCRPVTGHVLAAYCTQVYISNAMIAYHLYYPPLSLSLHPNQSEHKLILTRARANIHRPTSGLCHASRTRFRFATEPERSRYRHRTPVVNTIECNLCTKCCTVCAQLRASTRKR